MANYQASHERYQQISTVLGHAARAGLPRTLPTYKGKVQGITTSP